ncbi:DUF6477 family protein [Falsirhodobacter algicola]|uniref:Uncharacterized protein n=1 Tax=Falsirhodobacter algicola TaxID=2692330 RepID=A0A8J8MRB3_9RHOB|nr:DUF6477 family protein [Falsirhodobacter algicola]QUS35079.1 hypothetical protein GR316_01590 [Falsirhodobacter algicola]
MTDIRATLATLSRPRLLVRAARMGVADYRRDRDLRRLTGTTGTDSPLPHLLEQEERLEETRRRGCASYSAMRHVEVLIALMAEARMRPPLRVIPCQAGPLTLMAGHDPA